jgi:hypothetical protein
MALLTGLVPFIRPGPSCLSPVRPANNPIFLPIMLSPFHLACYRTSRLYLYFSPHAHSFNLTRSANKCWTGGCSDLGPLAPKLACSYACCWCVCPSSPPWWPTMDSTTVRPSLQFNPPHVSLLTSTRHAASTPTAGLSGYCPNVVPRAYPFSSHLGLVMAFTDTYSHLRGYPAGGSNGFQLFLPFWKLPTACGWIYGCGFSP